MKNKNLFKYFFLVYLFIPITTYSDSIKISSERLNVSRDESVSVFLGNVYAEDSDIKLWSDKVSVFYDDNKERIYKIIAEKNIKIISDGITAYGNFSEYKIDDDELLLEGDVIVIEKNNSIQSDKLILDLANSTSIITSKPNKRVKAQINNLDND